MGLRPIRLLLMQCLRFFHDYFQWKKILVRATHLVLVFFVISTLIFQSSELNYAIHSSNYIYCFLYGFLVYISLFFYFLTCYIDPGYVPYNKFHNTLVTSDSEDDEVYIENAVQSSTTSTNSVPMRKCLHCNIQVGEKVARHRITYLKHITEEYNPFHEGYCSNMCTFFCECREKHWDVVYKKSLEHVVIQM
ncbi:unnamed protein product [Didymodactylos carnosus]|uniref:Uncharacterized protein n=1 Tax=Didymodactylos carnosus TaxID=1234261 RepID=A0A814KZ09_9BILA|nr:unnamed protein product [Didymodactylos carnosus]CAF3825343.1 unnamed protein product [Didymodactylos carnosus]